MAIAAAAYPQLQRDQNIDLEDTASAWAQALAGGPEIPHEHWESALAAHIRSSKWFPALAELLAGAKAEWQTRNSLRALPEPEGPRLTPKQTIAKIEEIQRLAGSQP
ncbi:MAG: hypothetical protein M0Z43_04455 [Acidithiobacillus sp.]|nr:hypothetical protein [Acidithiobacillus sp.]